MIRTFRHLSLAALLVGGLLPVSAWSTPVSQGEYRIGANDQLDVVVWKQADLTTKVTVAPDGTVHYPLVGEIAAVGMTPSELGEEITEGLSVYVVDPKVTVIPRVFDAPSVHVIGEVKIAGRVDYREGARLSDYLAAAGGPGDDASLEEVSVTRNIEGTPVQITVDAKRLLEDGDPRSDIELMEGDVVYVPKGFTLLDARLLIISLSGVIGIALGLGRLF